MEILARVLSMDGGIGTRYEVDGDGLLTGGIVEPFVYGEGKVEAMRAFAAEHDIDLGASWAYSDSASDLPMLRAVGRPVAVNPDAELARVATEEGWQVMRFEKLGRRLAIVGATVVAAAARRDGHDARAKAPARPSRGASPVARGLPPGASRLSPWPWSLDPSAAPTSGSRTSTRSSPSAMRSSRPSPGIR